MPGLPMVAPSVLAPVFMPVSVSVTGDVAALKAMGFEFDMIKAVFASPDASSVPPAVPSVKPRSVVASGPVY